MGTSNSTAASFGTFAAKVGLTLLGAALQADNNRLEAERQHAHDEKVRALPVSTRVATKFGALPPSKQCIVGEWLDREYWRVLPQTRIVFGRHPNVSELRRSRDNLVACITELPDSELARIEMFIDLQAAC